MRHRIGIAATAALALAAVATSPASAQSGGPAIKDGSYGGFFTFSGGLVVSDETIANFVAANVTGPADITVIDGVVTGSATLLTEVDVAVGGASGAGSQTVTAAIQGSASAPSLVAGGSLPLTITFAGCSQVWGTWNEGFAREVTAAGADIRWAYGSFNLQANETATTPDELADASEQMTTLFDNAQIAMRDAEASGPHNRIPDAVTNVVDEALRAQSELSIGSPCSDRRSGISEEEAAEFLSQLSTLISDFVLGILNDPGFSPTADDWTSIISDLGRAGLLGSKTGDPGRSAELTRRITEILEIDLDLYVASGDLAEGTPVAIATLRNALAVNPNMRAGAVTALEVALVIGLVW